MKKEYTTPLITTYNVGPSKVICSSPMLDSGSTSTMRARKFLDIESDTWDDEE